MFRYFLLLVLSAPLGYVAYEQGMALFGLAGPVSLRDDPVGKTQAALQDVSKEAAKRGQPRDDVQKALLSIAEKCPDLAPGGAPADTAITAALKAHASNLEDVHNLFIGFAEVQKDPRVKDRVRSATYKGWLDAVLTLADQRNKLEEDYDKYKRGDDPAPILARLKKYSADPWADRGVVKSIEGGLRRKNLPPLDGLSSKLSEVLANPPQSADIARLQKSIEEATGALKQFVMDFPDAPPHTIWAQQQAKRWAKCGELLEIVARDASIAAPREVAGHVDRYAALLKGSELPPEVRPLVQKSALRFCKGFLTKLSRDDNVLIEGKTYPRNKVTIGWINGDSEALTAWESRTKLDERALGTAEHNDKVNYFEVNKKTLTKPIYPTAKTKAALAYNDALAKVAAWPSALRGVLDVCESDDYKALLAAAQRRTQAVYEAMTAHRELFGGD